MDDPRVESSEDAAVQLQDDPGETSKDFGEGENSGERKGLNLLDLPDEILQDLIFPKIKRGDLEDYRSLKRSFKEMIEKEQRYLRWAQDNSESDEDGEDKISTKLYELYEAMAKYIRITIDDQQECIIKFEEKLAFLSAFACTCKRGQALVRDFKDRKLM